MKCDISSSVNYCTLILLLLKMILGSKPYIKKLHFPFFFQTRYHCMKGVRIWSFSGSYFPVFGLNTGRYSVSLRVQSECGKISEISESGLKTHMMSIALTDIT